MKVAYRRQIQIVLVVVIAAAIFIWWFQGLGERFEDASLPWERPVESEHDFGAAELRDLLDQNKEFLSTTTTLEEILTATTTTSTSE